MTDQEPTTTSPVTFYAAIRDDPTLTPEGKIAWLYDCADDYYGRMLRAEALLRELVAKDAYSFHDGLYCKYCRYPLFPDDLIDAQISSHRHDCPIARARALLAEVPHGR